MLFRQDVVSRTPKAQSASPNEKVRIFRAQVVKMPSTGQPLYRGTLFVTDINGDQTSREIDGSTCDEVVNALVIFTAIAIDPNANIAKSTNRAEPSDTKPTPQPTTTVDNPKPSPAVTTTQTPPVLPAPESTQPSAPAAEASKPAQETIERSKTKKTIRTTNVDIALGLDGRSGLTPPIGWGLSASVWLRSESRYSPSLYTSIIAGGRRISAKHQLPDKSEQSGEIAYGWLGVRVQGCILKGIAGPLSITPCVGVETALSRVEPNGAITRTEGPKDTLWLAPLIALHGRLPEDGRFALEYDASILVPLNRQHYRFDSTSNGDFSTPVVAGSGLLAFSVRIP